MVTSIPQLIVEQLGHKETIPVPGKASPPPLTVQNLQRELKLATSTPQLIVEQLGYLKQTLVFITGNPSHPPPTVQNLQR